MCPEKSKVVIKRIIVSFREQLSFYMLAYVVSNAIFISMSESYRNAPE